MALAGGAHLASSTCIRRSKVVKYASVLLPTMSLASLICSAPLHRRDSSYSSPPSPDRPRSTRPVRFSTCCCIRRRLSACYVACSLLASSIARYRHSSSIAAANSRRSSSSLCRARSLAAVRSRWPSISLRSWMIALISPSTGCYPAARASPPVFPFVSPTSWSPWSTVRFPFRRSSCTGNVALIL